MTARPRLYDGFNFFNELDLLDLRLHELDPVVDCFIVCESTATYQGREKPLVFAENKERFAAFLPKIRHVVVDGRKDFRSSWEREIHQREQIRTALSDAGPGDVLLMSDIDEIPRAERVREVMAGGIGARDVYCFELDWYNFFLDLRLREKWSRLGPRMVRVSSLATINGLRGVYAPRHPGPRDAVRWVKACLRMKRLVRRRLVRDGGWHFSWLGGLAAVARKGSALSEHRDVSTGQKDAAWAERRIGDLLSREARYDVVAIDERHPGWMRERMDLFDRYRMPDA
ncbi:hypothetical protein CSC94_22000 [Zhengella mangrovi]|uniref:Beta-1,4-mannosyl-glycoprotein beta-1,4-N-acetylglucosaminyltransferase n=1 Tax=Zhengella mangrovi TaxID=1982044 RepID=A0A2G1QH74_9HYPH|nr:hypothetical protein [Zhengella mangrovi]PHP64862.1 hypothetical protein CSC94_22000 [Zhengella mangrovi]